MQDAVGKAKIGGYHGWAGRLGDLIQSLRAVMEEKPDVLVPVRGPVIRNPKAAVELLIRRLQEVYKNYLSINAGHWYFKERYDILAKRVLEPSEKVDWMDYAEVIEKKPPDWVVPIHNARVLISAAKRAFLIDCGSEAIIKEVEELEEQGRFRQLDGLFITHYHDDHTEKVTEVVGEFGCPVYACRELADILRRPEAHRLPAMTARPVANLTVVPEGHKRKWQEFQLTYYNFPGQTLYHGALLVEKEGEGKIFFIGDSFTPSGIDDYCLQNRNFLYSGKGYFYCLGLLHKIPAETLLINQHVVEPFRYSPEQLKLMETVLTKRKQLLEELFPWGGSDYGIDEQWAWFYPYGNKVRTGEELKLSVKLFNHANTHRTYHVKPNVPKGFQVKPESASVSIEPGKERGLDFRVVIPKQLPEKLYILTADIRFEQWRLNQWCEAMIEISE
jgi:glyoxylase-like metal-dependent hydrolase (beta-lactamase superfamily II)